VVVGVGILFFVAPGVKGPSFDATDAVIPGCSDADVSTSVVTNLLVPASSRVLKDAITSSYAVAVASLVSSTVYASVYHVLVLCLKLKLGFLCNSMMHAIAR